MIEPGFRLGVGAPLYPLHFMLGKQVGLQGILWKEGQRSLYRSLAAKRQA